MIVSIINWQPLYWVNHPNADEVFFITMEEFQKIQSWLATIVWKEVVDIPVVIVEKTEEELATERKQALLGRLATIQEQSLSKRLEYITARDMLPEWNIIREMKMDKLSYEWDQLLLDFETLVGELVTEFGEEALIDII